MPEVVGKVKGVSDPSSSTQVVCRTGVEAGSGPHASETGRGGERGVDRGGGCARGSVGMGMGI
jgi:hypothetical protein